MTPQIHQEHREALDEIIHATVNRVEGMILDGESDYAQYQNVISKGCEDAYALATRLPKEEWVNVEERSPKDGDDGEYLCAIVWETCDESGWREHRGQAVWHHAAGNWLEEHAHSWVTHWRPLPQPPEEGK